MIVLRRIKCILVIWRDAVYSNIFLFFLVTVCISLGLVVFAKQEEFDTELHYFHEYGFNQSVMYLNPFWNKTDDFNKALEVISSCELLDHIEFESVPVHFAECIHSPIGLMIYEYGEKLNNGRILELTRGRLPVESENEVVLNDDLRGIYAIGDVIRVSSPDEEALFQYYDMMDSQMKLDYTLLEKTTEYDLTVVGFFHQDTPLIHESNHRHISLYSLLEHRFDKVDDIISENLDSIEADGGYNFGIAIAGNLEFEGKNLAISDPKCMNTFLFLIPKEGWSQEQLIESLPKEIRDQCKTYHENEKNYITQRKTEIQVLKSIEIGDVLVSVILITVFLFQSFWTRRKEMLAYYFYGCSWKRAILYVSTMFLPGYVLGGVFSWSIRFTLLKSFNLSNMYARLSYFTIPVAGILVILLVILSVFFLSAVSKSPIDLQRGE